MGGRGAKSNLKSANSTLTAESKGSGGLTRDEIDALEAYVSGEGMWINQYLRGNVETDFHFTADDADYLKNLDSATNGEVGKTTLYRSVDAAAIFGNISAGEYDDLRQYLLSGADDNAFGGGNYAAQKVKNLKSKISQAAGKTFSEKGFMSTSKSKSVADEWGDFSGSEQPIVMKITTSHHTKGADVSFFDKNVAVGDEQYEVLLKRGQSYTVGKIYWDSGNIYVDVTMK